MSHNAFMRESRQFPRKAFIQKNFAIRLSPNDGLSFRPGENISQRIYFFLPGKEKSIPDVSLSLVRSTIEP